MMEQKEFAPGLPDIQVKRVTVSLLLIRDPAYPLHSWFMKPFTGILDGQKELFSYKLRSCEMVAFRWLQAHKGHM